MDSVNMLDPMTLSNVYQRALAFEKQNRQVGSLSSPSITGVSCSGNVASHFAPSQAKTGGGNTGPVSRTSDSSGLKYINYGEPAYKEYEEAPFYDDEPECEKEYVSGDVGVNLVVRHSCLTPKADGDDWLKHNIFQSACTISGKVCTFVCDSSSCDNLLGAEVVQKLGLKTKNNPKPYKLQWLKKGDEVIVSKHVHVSYSVRNTYKNNVLCDVVPMDACHLLLGRPWEYDRDITHNGRTSTYSFLFGGVKITLMPNKPKEVVNKPTGTLLTLLQFEDEPEIGDDVFVLIGKEVAEDSKILEAMIPLLEEFLDVFLDEPHYRISPGEHEELHRQVEELVSKGHVRESISPCAVPALLTPKKDGTWRMCVDSRAINKITMRYRFPIPRLDDLLDQISGATIFTKLDLKSGYYQIRLRPGDEWKTAFKTREGLYEWLVMPFGLSNAPSTFMRVMNQLFRPFIGKFVVVYFDDILIYSASFNEHVTHVRQVLTLLWKDSFYAATRKCMFMTPKVSFLRYVDFGDGIQVFELHTNASKVAIAGVLNQVVQDVKHWRHYLFYKEFILFTDHDSLRHIRTQDKVDVSTRRWCKAGEKPRTDFFQHNGFLFKGNQLCIPDSSLRLQIIKELHGEGHVGRDNSLQLVQASYFWSTMRKEVDRYVKRCRMCHVLKGTTTNACLYMPLPVPLQPWVDISMDFVLGLPRTQRDAVNVAQLFFRDVYRLHGLPSSIVSDRDTRQTKVVNKSLGNLLRCLVGDHVKAWDQKLCQAEFAHNHVVNRSTGFSPFHVVYSAQPRGPLDLMTPCVSSYVPKKVQDFVAGLHDVHKAVHENLVRANSKYKQDTDHKRRHVDFEEGDFVWAVLTKYHFPVGEYNKLSAKKISPLEIAEKINSNAYRLKLPSHIRCFDVFNVKHLIPYHGDSFGDDLAMNSRANFVYPRGNDGGPSIEERADFWYQEPKFLIKMPPRKNRTLNEVHEKELEDRVMARMEERFDQFVDQLSDRMDQLMNRCGNRNVRGTDDEQSENPFGEDD
ncbi:putative reverse transcriptase domain-containing protein, partial [Tanacetum coccineum]